MKNEQNLLLSTFKETLAKMNPDFEAEKIPFYHQQIIFAQNEIKDTIEGVDKEKDYDFSIINNTINSLLVTLGFKYSGEGDKLEKIEEFYQYALQNNNNNDEITITDLDKRISEFNNLI